MERERAWEKERKRDNQKEREGNPVYPSSKPLVQLTVIFTGLMLKCRDVGSWLEGTCEDRQ